MISTHYYARFNKDRNDIVVHAIRLHRVAPFGTLPFRINAEVYLGHGVVLRGDGTMACGVVQADENPFGRRGNSSHSLPTKYDTLSQFWEWETEVFSGRYDNSVIALSDADLRSLGVANFIVIRELADKAIRFRSKVIASGEHLVMERE